MTGSPPSVGLSPSEIREVTGFSYHAKQINALAMMGISYYVRPDGSPFVPRDSLKPEAANTGKAQEWVVNM